MRILVRAIQFENYKNIKNSQVIRLGDITTLVGANESGKTNVLQAISRLKDSLEENDTKMGTPHKPALLRFLIEVKDNKLKSFLTRSIKNLSDKDLICIEREGEKKEISLSNENFGKKAMQLNTMWKNTSTEIIEINGIKIEQNQELFSKDLKKYVLMKLVKSGQLQKIDEETILNRIKDEILKNLPDVESWNYTGYKEDEEKYYIPNSVPYQQFVDNPETNTPTKNLFLIAEKENRDLFCFQQKLKDLENNGTEIQNYLDKVSDELNKLIKKVWSGSVLELKLAYQADSLRIDTYEGGTLKPPSVRSEGMKWFLSFLINFHSRGELEEKIILFDQPGERLHPGGQKELRVRLGKLVTENQVVYATQSPFLVDRNDWGGVRFLKKVKGETSILPPSREDVRNDELLRYSLGFTLADVGQANELNIVTEGFTDSFILLEWARSLNEQNIKKKQPVIVDLNKISIFDKHGRGSIRKGVTELEASGLVAIGLFDSDSEGQSALTEAKKNKSLSKHFVSYQDFLGRSEVKTAEDLVPENVFKKACRKVFTEIKDSDLMKVSKNPRWQNLCETLNAKDVNKRSIKEKLWEEIISSIGDLDISIIEAKHAKKILESCCNLLNKFYEERQRSI